MKSLNQQKVDSESGLGAVLFDLDGTLVDSAPDITEAVNELLSEAALDPLPLESVKRMIGNGLRKLVERAFHARGHALSEDALETRFDAMMAIYPKHLTNRSRVKQGAMDAIIHFRDVGARVGVVTNKPVAFSRTILSHYGFAGLVDLVLGGDSGHGKKPAPEMLLAACENLETLPKHALMIGDSINDLNAARSAGIACVLVRGGYSDRPIDELGAHYVIDSLSDVARLYPADTAIA